MTASPGSAPRSFPSGPPGGRRRALVVLAVTVNLVAIITVLAFVVFGGEDGGEGADPNAVSSPADPNAGSSPPDTVVLRASGALRSPVRFLRVTDSHDRRQDESCARGETPSLDGHDCYRLGKGMTVTRLESIVVRAPEPQNLNWRVEFTLASSDVTDFAALTRDISTAVAGTPQQLLAMETGGTVISAPMVEAPITDGRVQVSIPGGRSEAEDLLRRITGSA